MEESKKNTTHVGHIYSSTKNEQKQNKKMQRYDRKFVVKKNINRFRFIMTPTRGKDL